MKDLLEIMWNFVYKIKYVLCSLSLWRCMWFCIVMKIKEYVYDKILSFIIDYNKFI